MMNTEKLKFIDGTFSNHEAKEILMSVFNRKIQFHELKNFGSKERYGVACELSQKRISELKSTIAQIEKIMEEAMSKNVSVKINSEIYISLADE